MWMIFGTGAVLAAILNLIRSLTGKNAEWSRFISLALTALTLCAFYADGAGRVMAGDIGGLMDIMPTMSKALWVCTGLSILLNSVSLYRKKA